MTSFWGENVDSSPEPTGTVWEIPTMVDEGLERRLRDQFTEDLLNQVRVASAVRHEVFA